jgi:hypothetical protein
MGSVAPTNAADATKPAAVPTVELSGHLTEESLGASLAGLEPSLRRTRVPILIDCRKMTDYDLAARHAFVRWNATHRDRVARVAIVTDNRLWWMVIHAMSLASGQEMKGFAQREEAIAWARRE